MLPPLLNTLVVTSPFGPRGPVRLADGTMTRGGQHNGTDYRAPIGALVVAPADVRVTNINRTAKGGLQLFAESLDGRFRFAFVHLSNTLAVVGDFVAAGGDLARSGNSGGAVEHLHVEARDLVSGDLVDPHTLWSDDAAPPSATKKSAGLLVAGVAFAGGVAALLLSFLRGR